MAASTRAFMAGCFAVLAGCHGPDFSQPPVNLPLSIGYPPQTSGTLPSDTLGGVETVRVQVKSPAGLPASGVEVIWDGSAFPSPVYPELDTTDVDGMSTVTWRLRPYTGRQTVLAYVPGANGSPVEYRIDVFPPPPPK